MNPSGTAGEFRIHPAIGLLTASVSSIFKKPATNHKAEGCSPPFTVLSPTIAHFREDSRTKDQTCHKRTQNSQESVLVFCVVCVFLRQTAPPLYPLWLRLRRAEYRRFSRLIR